jgi:hypothetical protein
MIIRFLSTFLFLCIELAQRNRERKQQEIKAALQYILKRRLFTGLILEGKGKGEAFTVLKF